MELSVLLFQQRGCWVAQCLEYNIAAQGNIIDDAVYELQRLICGQIAIRKELKLPSLEAALSPTPEIYRQLYEKATPLDKDKYITTFHEGSHS